MEQASVLHVRAKSAARVVLVALLYLLGAEIGQLLSLPGHTASFWPAGGVFLAALLLSNPRDWRALIPAILLANTVSDVLLHETPLLASAGLGLALVVEVVSAAWLLRWASGGRFGLRRLQDVLLLSGVAALLSTAAGAMLSAAVVMLAFDAPFTDTLRTVWSGDMLGVLVVTPLMLGAAVEAAGIRRALTARRLTEAGSILLIVSLATHVVFTLQTEPIVFAVIPLLVWAAVRLELGGVTVAIALVTVIALGHTVSGNGPYGTRGDVAAQMTLLQVLLSILAATSLALAAVMRERRQAGREVAQSEQRFRDLTDAMPQIVWIADPRGHTTFLNKRWDQVSDRPSEEIFREGWTQRLHPEDNERMRSRWNEAMQRRSLYEVEFRLRFRENGPYRWQLARAVPVLEGGQVVQWYGTLTDIDDSKQAARQLAESEEIYRDLFDNVNDFVLSVAADGRLLLVNRAWRDALEYRDTDVPALSLFDIIHPDDFTHTRQFILRRLAGDEVGTLRTRFVSKTGRVLVVEGHVTCRFENGKATGMRAIFRDVTDREAYEQELEKVRMRLEVTNQELRALSTTDELTGLKNRRAFDTRLEDEIARTARDGSLLSLILLDVDSFKQFNDTFGHPAGDVVLRRVAELIRKGVRGIDIATRFGGEEFAVILPRTDEEAALLVAERVRTLIEQAPWTMRSITVSLGIATMGSPELTAPLLVSQADQALYQAKRSGRNRSQHASELVNAPV